MLKRKSKIIGRNISGPTAVTHDLHVDSNLEWSGPEAAGQFEFAEKLGEGSFGSVFRAIHKISKREFAIKTIPVQENDDLGDIVHEIDILKKCSSPYIVSYYGCFKNQHDFWILMDFCAYGSLRDLMDRMEKPLEERVVAHVCLGALAGLAYLHSKNIIHRDVKAANILLDGSCTAKLADFGVSRQMTNTWAKTMTVVGTPLWMAPEVAKMQSYSFSADIWSMGITAMELAEFYPPYADMSPIRAMILITRNPPPKLNGRFSNEFNDFIAKCLVKDPEGRPDALSLSRHAFLANSHDGCDLLRTLLNEHSADVKKGEKMATQTKRSPPRTRPPPPPTTRSVVYDGGDSGTVVMHDSSIGGNDDGTVVMHDPPSIGGGDDGTVVFHQQEQSDASGTVVYKQPTSRSAVGSMRQVHDFKRQLTIVSPTSDGKQGVSKRDFFFILVGAVTSLFISVLYRSIFG